MTGCNWNLAKIASATGGDLHGADVVIEGVGTDTRALTDGQLFVALKGPNFDAHDFIKKAVDAGAVAVMVERELKINVPQIVVKDCLKALGELSSEWRCNWGKPLIAVTGSNGKTTVKEMLASIFRQQGNVLATAGNLNNDIGVPLTLLKISETDQTAIIEMGANHPKEIAYLTRLAKPEVAMITNAASAHLEGFGSLEGVAKAKGEIFEGLSSDNYAVINADDKFANTWHQLASEKKKITFGLHNQADVTCRFEGVASGNELKVVTPNGELNITLKLLGEHNVMNALAATAASLVAGASLENIRDGLANMNPVPGRLQSKSGVNGSRIIDDTYNANPNSLNAAIDVLVQSKGRLCLALGDMGELGADTQELHIQAGKRAKMKGVNNLYALGPDCLSAVKAFGDNGEHFDSHEAMIERLRQELTSDVTLLIKGSRAMKMDKVVDALVLNTDQSGG